MGVIKGYPTSLKSDSDSSQDVTTTSVAGNKIALDANITNSSLTVAEPVTVDQSTHDNLNANVNLQVGDADVANGNPVPVSDAGGSITVDGVPQLTTVKAIDSTAFDLQAAPFSSTSSITNDYILDAIEFNFSTAESKTITVTTADGTKLYEDTNTNQHVALTEIDQGFDANQNFTVAITQFGSPGTCDVVAIVREGSSTLGGNPVLDSSSVVGIKAIDSPSIDAFGRWRTSAPVTIFDSKQLWDSAPLLWDDSETSGSGTTSAHSTDEAATTIGVGATTAGTRVRQTFRRFNYQSGKSQLILMTGVLDASGGGTGIARSWGYYDDENGLFLKDDEGTIKFVRRTFVTGSAVDNEVSQSSWNIDTMDGGGASGITLDFTKTQILIIDFEWLGVGRARLGFVVDGIIVYAHEFLNANVLDKVYMSTSNLPLRYEIANDGTGAASELAHICATVISEGGVNDIGVVRYASTEGTHVDANSAGTVYALVGIRLKSTHLDCTVKPLAVSIMSETNDDFEWLVYMNPTVAGTFTYGDITNACTQFATGATANTVSGGTIIAGGFSKAEITGGVSMIGASSGGATGGSGLTAVLLGAAIDGTVDELVLAVRPLSANADIQGSITFRELV